MDSQKEITIPDSRGSGGQTATIHEWYTDTKFWDEYAKKLPKYRPSWLPDGHPGL